MIVINAILESFRSLKDKTLSLNFSTQEPTSEQIQAIATSSQKYGYLVFSGNQLTSEQLDEIDKAKNDLYDSNNMFGTNKITKVLIHLKTFIYSKWNVL